MTKTDNLIDFELAIETASYYGITNSNAKMVVEEIKKIVNKNWRRFATEFKLSRNAIEYMEPAFNLAFK